ncbi:hypothetical protein J2S43_002122 [Catenuloplanes nepalensis]|uniref:ABC transporter permease n=1 Tax=Catenuloplanes nepalensis TaxID=587533 RepID=A0ABT9MQA6_9ACTN|nr:ABC transporter permease subunit [Catenuloplanes nepalensis]MDP9793610.1 hypothetical protein [Catenuloplanes nepalensis]
MLWVTWRQHRWQIVGGAALVLAYCGFLLYVGADGHRAIAECLRVVSTDVAPPACVRANRLYNALTGVMLAGSLLPLTVGVFWGAPMVSREFEQGTYRLTFTQSIGRGRWLLTKTAVLAVAAAVLGSSIGISVLWSVNRFAPMFESRVFGDPVAFAQAGLVPAGAWVLSLATGVLIGAVARRVTVAMALTLIVLALFSIGLTAIRPYYFPASDIVLGGASMFPDPSPVAGRSGWLRSISYVDSSGRELSSREAGAICDDPGNTYPTADCLNRHELLQQVSYHPAGRYVWFQLAELSLLLAGAAAAVAAARWSLER